MHSLVLEAGAVTWVYLGEVVVSLLALNSSCPRRPRACLAKAVRVLAVWADERAYQVVSIAAAVHFVGAAAPLPA